MAIILHITERELDLFVTNQRQLSEQERERIQTHLSQCKLCGEHLRAIQGFYRELEVKLHQSPSPKDERLAEELLQPNVRKLLPSEALIETYAEAIEPLKRSLPQRFFRYVQLYPVRSAGYATALAAALVVTVLLLRPAKDLNPAFAGVNSQVLYVYNKTGEVLWTKNGEGLPDVPYVLYQTKHYYHKVDNARSYPLKVFDIDGDGINEVLFSGYSAPLFSDDMLYCINSGGNLRWKAGMGRGVRFGAVDFTHGGDWHVRRFVSIQRTPSERIRLFVAATLGPSWPTKIAELDPKTGKELQAYWNAGAMSTMVVADINRDGINELVCGGINNTLNRACVIVFDPAMVLGVSPTTPEYHPADLPPGTQKYYAMLSRPEFVDSIATQPSYNMIGSMLVTDGGQVEVQTIEGINERWRDQTDIGGFVYSFDEKMQANYVVVDDKLVKSIDRARREGLMNENPLNATMYEKLKSSVLYWDGEKSRSVKYEELKKRGISRFSRRNNSYK